MEEKLALAREMASCLGGIEVQLISAEDGTLEEFLCGSIYGTHFPIAPLNTIQRVLLDLQPERVYILSGILDLSYAVVRLKKDPRLLCIGPCMTSAFSESKIRNYLRPFRLSGSSVQRIIAYCGWQPMLSSEKLYTLSILLCRRVLGLSEPIAHQQIDYNWNPAGHSAFLQKESDAGASQIHQVEQRYEASAALTEAVKQGNLSLAYSFIQRFQPGATDLIRSHNPLRNAQNLCIVLNTQLRHALEDCKIHPYLLDKVSGEIAIQIETLKTTEEAGRFSSEIIRRYCTLALEKNYIHLNRLAREAVVYIKTHLSENVTVKDTAAALLVSPNYLSSVFRQELGMTFIDFLNRERITQAAALLRRTNMQIQHIASAVGYNNTSYFTRQFVRVFSDTPSQYRTKGLL